MLQTFSAEKTSVTSAAEKRGSDANWSGTIEQPPVEVNRLRQQFVDLGEIILSFAPNSLKMAAGQEVGNESEADMRRAWAARLPALALVSLLLWAPGAAGEERKVVATVNGDPVYEDEMRYAESEIAADLAQVGEEQRRAVVLQYIVNTRLLAKAAVGEGLDKDAAFTRRLDYYRQQALRDAYVDKNVDNAIGDDQLRPIYDAEFAAGQPEEEVHARHILLKTEDEAKAVIKRLAGGEDFVTLAKSLSVGPSGADGGELGWFGRGQMAKSFEDAAFGLQPGQLSPPVESRFGWHVIKVEERRQRPVPGFDEVKDQIRAPLVQEKARELIRQLRQQAKLDVPDAALAKQLQALDQGQ
jgi:peptidyl-prolyl cis-trans isomerase C